MRQGQFLSPLSRVGEMRLVYSHECNLAFANSSIGESGVKDTNSLICLVFWMFWIVGSLDLLERAGTDSIAHDRNRVVLPSATVHNVQDRLVFVPVFYTISICSAIAGNWLGYLWGRHDFVVENKRGSDYCGFSHTVKIHERGQMGAVGHSVLILRRKHLWLLTFKCIGPDVVRPEAKIAHLQWFGLGGDPKYGPRRPAAGRVQYGRAR